MIINETTKKITIYEKRRIISEKQRKKKQKQIKKYKTGQILLLKMK